MKMRPSTVAVEPEISWSAKFVDKVWRCQPTQAFVFAGKSLCYNAHGLSVHMYPLKSVTGH